MLTRSKWSSQTRFWCMVCLILTCGYVIGESYSFTEVFSTYDDGWYLGYPAINNRGDVVFSMNGYATSSFYTVKDGVLSIIGGPFNLVGAYSSLADTGTAAFSVLSGAVNGTYVPAGGAVCLGDEDNLVLIATVESDASFSTLGIPDLNNEGTVVFFATLDGGGSAIVASNKGVLSVLATFTYQIEDPVLANDGTIGYSQWSYGVFTLKEGVVTTIADRASGFDGTFDEVDINDSGDVVFTAWDLDKERVLGIGDGRSLRVLTDTSGPYSAVMAPSVNNSRSVVFRASLDVGGSGIFTGNDPVHDTVVCVGGSFFGSTVTALSLNPGRAINDSGQIVFSAVLADGKRGIFIARPDHGEPSE